MLDHTEILERAAAWMNGRRWRAKLAKRREFEQSLLEHSLVELDVLLVLMPILALPSHYGLSEEEKRLLTVAVPVHDTGKETDRWQAYIRGQAEWTPHIVPELTRAAVPEVCKALDLPAPAEALERVIAHCASFHHSAPGKSDGAILEAMLTGGSDRFLTLASIVKAIDHFCSAASAAEAQSAALADPALGKHLKVARHELVVRGVSSTFLHRAAEVAFERNGWKPLLYFTSSTVYGADPNARPLVPSADEIGKCLKAELDTALSTDTAEIMVGSPTGNILPKPELFSFKESRRYLRSASRKIRSTSFAKKKLQDQRKVVERYWAFKGWAGTPSDEQVREQVGRISTAQPEMLVFKFFKAMLDPDRIAGIPQHAVLLAKNAYEEKFGPGSWADLQSTSTLMAANDMAKTVDRFWGMPGIEVGHPEVGDVEQLPPQSRTAILIDLLDRVAHLAYSASGAASPRELLSETMAGAFVEDLILPSPPIEINQSAAEQLDHYSLSKPVAGSMSKRAKYFCPICNAAFLPESSIKASADFLANPQAHTNRGVAYAHFGYIVVCTSCYFERLLVRITLGEAPAETVVLMPQMSVGRHRGQQFVARVRQWVETAKMVMLAEAGAPNFGLSLSFVDQVAEALGDRDPYTLEPDQLTSLFSFRFTEDTQRKRRLAALKRLREEFDDDLQALNGAGGTSFSSWEAAIEALVANRLLGPEFRSIRREVFRLHETVHLICQTPNLLFVPLSYEVAAEKDESDTSKALRRLYVSLVLALAFDSSVAILRENEPADLESGRGLAFVPPIPAVRTLVQCDWLSVPEAFSWLAAIGAAAVLATDTGFPKRSALYQTLSAVPPERLARRVEENWRKQGQSRFMSLDQLAKIEAIAKPFRERVVTA